MDDNMEQCSDNEKTSSSNVTSSDEHERDEIL